MIQITIVNCCILLSLLANPFHEAIKSECRPPFPDLPAVIILLNDKATGPAFRTIEVDVIITRWSDPLLAPDIFGVWPGTVSFAPIKRLSGDITAKFVARGLQYTAHETAKWPVPFKGMKYYRNHPMNAKEKAAQAMFDPVCPMTGNKDISVVYKGKTYYFYSDGCKNKFLRKPLSMRQ